MAATYSSHSVNRSRTLRTLSRCSSCCLRFGQSAQGVKIQIVVGVPFANMAEECSLNLDAAAAFDEVARYYQISRSKRKPDACGILPARKR